tara:strand:- start:335 stop:1081 length:747 start_codon:yes stop_codon:yes gene_type:complete
MSAWTGQVTEINHARSFAKLLLDESGDLFWTETEQKALANEANRTVFRELVATNPEYFISTTSGPFTWPSGSEYIELSTASFLGSGVIPYKIIGVEDTPSAAAPGHNNLPHKWRPMRFADRYIVEQTSGRLYGDLSRHYVLVSNRLYVAPIPNEDLNIHIYWIPHIPDMTTDADVLLRTSQSIPNGAAEEFGALVGVYLAKLMNSKQQGQNPVIDQLWAEGLARMQNDAQLRNVDEPMSVRVTRAPWE